MQSKSMDLFLYDRDLRHESVEYIFRSISLVPNGVFISFVNYDSEPPGKQPPEVFCEKRCS